MKKFILFCGLIYLVRFYICFKRRPVVRKAVLSSSSSSFNAVIQSGYGPASDTLHYTRVEFDGADLIFDDDVLVRIHATSVNPVDFKTRNFGLGPAGMMWIAFPFINGRDVSGVVAKIGKNVTNFKVGDEVVALTDVTRMGTYSEYTVVQESAVAIKPKSLTHAVAAGVPLVGLTAWQLVLAARLQPPTAKTVCVLGGSGGLGSFLIPLLSQYCKVPSIVATCSQKNSDAVLRFGATQTIDRLNDSALLFDNPAYHHHFDVVIDVAGGLKNAIDAHKIIKAGGRWITVSGPVISLLHAHAPACC